MLFAVFLLLVSLDGIKSQFLVKTLPGLDGDLPFTLETGYIGVGASDDEQLFYYFIESEGNPKDDPLMIWLTGGPGCTSLSGLMFEIGPFTINYAISTLEEPILELVPYSWTKVANIIFLDQPAGSGFSYAKSPESYITNDTLSAKLAYSFLRKWLVDHPKFLSNPLYVGGDSYSGIMVPLIVQEIYNGNEIGEEPQMNIKGYAVGNPVTDTSGDYNSRIPFAHRMALLSDAIYQSAKENCGGEYLNVDPNNSLCIHALQAVDKCLERINSAQILEPVCDTSNTVRSNLSRRELRVFDKTSLDARLVPQVQKRWCRDDKDEYTAAWANRKDVREALHIHEEFNNIEWVRCNKSIQDSSSMENPSYTCNVPSVVGYHRHFADKKCRALVYNGDHDMLVSYLATLNWIQSLNLPVIDDWRPWFVDEQVAGYTMKYINGADYSLIYATVKGGGHTAPEYKPKECLNMFIRWLADDTLRKWWMVSHDQEKLVPQESARVSQGVMVRR
uniref:serine carboxypeptidase-like 13 isoform X1 n=1 Tax=Erigeron canadensis TaxID=72917 RepID=UPI001CB9CAFD|nr:serine carboxypeptidase-like 13 isoform X1 [Erigeron canadensis]XP_043624829.1 serine carboxypeptidase-like 13 isoform X1 [Erigeron canadensis]XP_043624830.1 serine carboxypeptidase-like 13 isoform X1 [Erigeron canadensis]